MGSFCWGLHSTSGHCQSGSLLRLLLLCRGIDAHHLHHSTNIHASHGHEADLLGAMATLHERGRKAGTVTSCPSPALLPCPKVGLEVSSPSLTSLPRARQSERVHGLSRSQAPATGHHASLQSLGRLFQGLPKLLDSGALLGAFLPHGAGCAAASRGFMPGPPN